MTSQPDMPALIDQLGVASKEARDLLADIRSATKELRRAVRESQEERAKLKDALKAMMDEDLSERVREGLAEYASTIETAMDNAVAKVTREFDALRNLVMTGDKRGRGLDIGRVIREGRI